MEYPSVEASGYGVEGRNHSSVADADTNMADGHVTVLREVGHGDSATYLDSLISYCTFR